MIMTRIIFAEDNFDNYLKNHISNIDTSLEETKAYIYSIFKGFLNSQNDLSKESIVLLYNSAKSNQDFNEFQKLADWIFFTRTNYSESLPASTDLYDTIARNSYYKCYIILNKKLTIYEEMADRFSYFIKNLTSMHNMRQNIINYHSV